MHPTGCLRETVNPGTLGTPFYSLREGEKEIFICKLVDNQTSVPSVPAEVRPPTVEDCQQSETGVPSVPTEKKGCLPHLTPSGDLVIPFDSPERYHWWSGGQS